MQSSLVLFELALLSRFDEAVVFFVSSKDKLLR